MSANLCVSYLPLSVSSLRPLLIRQHLDRNHLGSIQPTIAPAFSYSWISLISHRHFMPRLLQGNNKEVRAGRLGPSDVLLTDILFHIHRAGLISIGS